jgi:hypothetical protein
MHSIAIEHQPMKNAKLARRKHWEQPYDNSTYLGNRSPTKNAQCKNRNNKPAMLNGEY